MDDVGQRAADDYHALLRDEKGLREELEAALPRAHAARPTSPSAGARSARSRVPTSSRPPVYEQIRGVCRGIFRRHREGRDGPGQRALGPRRPDCRRSASSWPSTRGFRRSAPTARLDSFLTTVAYQFVELNAETPAGIAYNEVLVEVFLELPLVKKFQERYVAAALPRARAPPRDAPRLLPRGRGQGREAHDRDRGLRGRPHPHRAPHVPRVLRGERLPVGGLRPAPPHLRGRAAAPRGARHRHRLQAAARERAPGADRPAARPLLRGGEGRGRRRS